MELLNYSQIESKELQIVSWVVCLSFDQASAGKGEHSVSPIILSLVETGPQAEATGIGMQLKRLAKVSICYDRHCCALVLQFIKGLPSPLIPMDQGLLLAHILSSANSFKGCTIWENLVLHWQ